MFGTCRYVYFFFFQHFFVFTCVPSLFLHPTPLTLAFRMICLARASDLGGSVQTSHTAGSSWFSSRERASPSRRSDPKFLTRFVEEDCSRVRVQSQAATVTVTVTEAVTVTVTETVTATTAVTVTATVTKTVTATATVTKAVTVTVAETVTATTTVTATVTETVTITATVTVTVTATIPVGETMTATATVTVTVTVTITATVATTVTAAGTETVFTIAPHTETQEAGEKRAPERGGVAEGRREGAGEVGGMEETGRANKRRGAVP